jgi:hypothetical protein
MIVHHCEQGSPEWFALRAGMPTASEFSKLITSTGELSKSLQGYAITLAGEKYAGKPLDAFEGNGYTERGKLLEADARSAYVFLHDYDVEQVGFVTDDDQCLGCSPDGIIGNDGLVEMKCLKAENHIKALLYYKKHKKCPPDYIQQTQGQILICEREWCDLVFYHPDLPQLVIRQMRDDHLQVLLLSAVVQVIDMRDKILADIQEAA